MSAQAVATAFLSQVPPFRYLDEEALARVRAPAGLDLGPVAHEEIAVAVLAELVQLRAAAGPRRGGAAARHEATDPVCGMRVDVPTARYRAVHAGRTYHLCSAGCLARFEADPTAYLAPSGGSPGER